MAARARNLTLRAVLFADLEGYSRLVSDREADTLAFMEACFAAFRTLCPAHNGELIKTTGDGALVAFNSASEAVDFAMAVHESIAVLQPGEANPALFRIGIHIGEVERIGPDLYGHAVNIAARLQTLAGPGGVCVSHDVFNLARRGTRYDFIAAGRTALKNIPEPIAIYHVVLPANRERSEPSSDSLLLAAIGGLTAESRSGKTIVLKSERIRALLGYLALSAQFEETQRRLSVMLWPDQNIKTARRQLTNALRAAKHALDAVVPAVLYRKGDHIGLAAALVEIDLIAIRDRLARGAVSDVLIERPEWPEAILSEMDTVSRVFTSWLEVTRHNWRARITEALEACIYRSTPQEPEVKRAAAALLNLEPSHEQAIQALIRHHAATGNAGLAVKLFQDFRLMLRERFNISPSAETLALAEKLSAKTAPDASVKPRDQVRRPSIGLKPFDVHGIAAKRQHRVAGFRSELLANLSRFREWVVVEIDERASDAGKIAPPDYLITASGIDAANALELSATLLESATGRVIWSDMFELSSGEWIASQRLAVRRIAARLHIYLSSDRLARFIPSGGLSGSDYDEWLRGEHLLSLWSRSAEDEAEAIFRRVIRDNPNFAPAYAGLAGIYNVRHLIMPGSPIDAKGPRQALAFAQRAVSLDALDSRNHLVIGWSLAMDEDYEQAAVHYELAISLNPIHPRALISCAQGLAFVGAPQRAQELLDEAVRLAPFIPAYQWCYINSTRYFIGDYEGCLKAAERGAYVTLDTHGWCAAALAHLGRIDEARQSFARLVEAVKPVWAGGVTPSESMVFDWFTTAFPIGREEERQRLKTALRPLFS